MVMPGKGPNPRWYHLAVAMRRLGYDVSLVTSNSNHISEYQMENSSTANVKFHGVEYLVLKTRQYNRTASIARVISWFDFDFKLFRNFRHMTPDVVVISSLSLTSIIFGIYLKWRHGSRLVFEIRDIWPLTMIEEGGFSRWHPLAVYLRFIEKWGYRRADLIVGTMPNLKQHVNESGIRKPDDAFHTCGIGVAPDRAADVAAFAFSPEVEALLRGRTIIGYCGSIGLTNNLHDFVRYMDDCTRDDVVFVIAGDGADRQTFESRLKDHQNVVFLGRIAPDQVQAFLRRCDILFLSTLPSKVWDYGQSMNKIVDYMLAGKFIIAQYTGYPSFINEAGCGVFTDGAGLGDCLDAAIDMPAASRDAAGLAGREWLLEHQSYETLARDYLQKIESCARSAS
ncbi:MAG: glycosyltransferase family 4 protein [Candidatus Puniceispirillaceae bacterium]